MGTLDTVEVQGAEQSRRVSVSNAKGEERGEEGRIHDARGAEEEGVDMARGGVRAGA